MYSKRSSLLGLPLAGGAYQVSSDDVLMKTSAYAKFLSKNRGREELVPKPAREVRRFRKPFHSNSNDAEVERSHRKRPSSLKFGAVKKRQRSEPSNSDGHFPPARGGVLPFRHVALVSRSPRGRLGRASCGCSAKRDQVDVQLSQREGPSLADDPRTFLALESPCVLVSAPGAPVKGSRDSGVECARWPTLSASLPLPSSFCLPFTRSLPAGCFRRRIRPRRPPYLRHGYVLC